MNSVLVITNGNIVEWRIDISGWEVYMCTVAGEHTEDKFLLHRCEPNFSKVSIVRGVHSHDLSCTRPTTMYQHKDGQCGLSVQMSSISKNHEKFWSTHLHRSQIPSGHQLPSLCWLLCHVLSVDLDPAIATTPCHPLDGLPQLGWDHLTNWPKTAAVYHKWGCQECRSGRPYHLHHFSSSWWMSCMTEDKWPPYNTISEGKKGANESGKKNENTYLVFV